MRRRPPGRPDSPKRSTTGCSRSPRRRFRGGRPTATAGPFNGNDLVAAGLTTLTTSEATAAGGAVLNFASVPDWVVVGMEVHDLGLDQADIPAGTTVKAVSATSVTMTAAATGGGIAAGDSIGFV